MSEPATSLDRWNTRLKSAAFYVALAAAAYAGWQSRLLVADDLRGSMLSGAAMAMLAIEWAMRLGPASADRPKTKPVEPTPGPIVGRSAALERQSGGTTQSPRAEARTRGWLVVLNAAVIVAREGQHLFGHGRDSVLGFLVGAGIGMFCLVGLLLVAHASYRLVDFVTDALAARSGRASRAMIP